jgi:hypothetical protein
MAKAKGTTLLSLVKFLRKNRERAQGVLTEGLVHYLDERVQPSSWYPEEDLLGLLRGMLALVPVPRDEMLEQVGRGAAREHLEGVYGHLKPEDGDPEGLARRSVALWASQHDSGRFRVDRDAPGRATFVVRDFALPSPEMCGILGGYFGECLRLIGARDVGVAKRACCLRGDDACRWLVTWAE